jgi:hypothetical protein
MDMKNLILSMMLEHLEEKVTNPYAIGMAAAMKATGDEPPLKKSTITKAHKIAKGIEKNEEVELDEETMPGIIALRLSDRHMTTALNHKKARNMKGYAAHVKVAVSLEDAVIRAGRDMPIRSKRLEAASDKAFKDHPYRAPRTEEVEQIDEAYYVTNASTMAQTHDKPFKTSTAAISHANKEEDRTSRVHIVTHVKDGKIHKQWQYSPDHRGYASYTDHAGEDARSHGIKK